MRPLKLICFLLFTASLPLFSQPLKELHPILHVMSADTGAHLGEYIKGVGDLNKDGFSDVVVSARYQKRSYLYYGGNPMSSLAALTFKGGGAITSGDFNGDGWIDLAIGYLFQDTVFVYLGNPSTGMDTIPDIILSDEAHPISYNGFGNDLAGGDVDGDGIDDLVICGNDVVTPENDGKGKMYVFSGGTTMSTVARAIFWGDTTRAGLGLNVILGDINNDKKKDIIVLGHNQVSYNSKYQFYYYSIFPGDSAFNFTRAFYKRLKFEGFGQMLLRSFDVDGDKIDDFLVSGIDIYKGGADFDTTVDYHIPPLWNDTSANGIYPAVGGGGDFNGDGKRDFLMGTLAPRVLLYLGGDQGLKQNAVAFMKGDATDSFGDPFENAGDTNGDGIDDIIVGAVSYPLYRGWGSFYIIPGDRTLVTSIAQEKDRELEVFSLGQNYPNPFNSSTNISITLLNNSNVSLKIYDLLGREIETLISDNLTTGTYHRVWNAGNFASGVYFCRLQIDGKCYLKKILLSK